MIQQAAIFDGAPLTRLDSVEGIKFNGPDYEAAVEQDATTGRILQKQRERRQLGQMLREVPAPRTQPLTQFRQPQNISLSPRFARQDFTQLDATPVGLPVGGFTPPEGDPSLAEEGGPVSEILPPMDLPETGTAPQGSSILEAPPPDESMLDEEPLDTDPDLEKIGTVFNPRRLYRTFV